MPPLPNAHGRLYLLISKTPELTKKAGDSDYDLYDMGKPQNYMEMAARVALENENLNNFSNLSVKFQENLIRQLAKEARA
ncbi:hypothetical protein BCR43DRAFT_527885 [Syncephalastrum racemosum]|uniref:Uncharacterized protein n=1 Tax=Syncephalastrum racemosum TaxID=13706 RepID=A0A1X2H1J8_SYNRA|nr:hypothetical protein BCR43DRAFT_527885 [Syncephalastrum racemosum]